MFLPTHDAANAIDTSFDCHYDQENGENVHDVLRGSMFLPELTAENMPSQVKRDSFSRMDVFLSFTQ